MTVVASVPMQAVNKLPAQAAVLVGLVSLALVALPGFWALLNHFARIAHEGAHAIVGSVLDTRVTGVHLYRKAPEGEPGGYGETNISNEPGTGFAVAVVGYFGPSGFGLAAAALIAHGLILLVLWTGVVLLAILLPSLRTVFGIAHRLWPGFRAGLHHSQQESRGRSGDRLRAELAAAAVRRSRCVGSPQGLGGRQKLREITDVPPRLWFLFWLVGTGVALAYGFTLLV